MLLSRSLPALRSSKPIYRTFSTHSNSVTQPILRNTRRLLPRNFGSKPSNQTGPKAAANPSESASPPKTDAKPEPKAKSNSESKADAKSEGKADQTAEQIGDKKEIPTPKSKKTKISLGVKLALGGSVFTVGAAVSAYCWYWWPTWEKEKDEAKWKQIAEENGLRMFGDPVPKTKSGEFDPWLNANHLGPGAPWEKERKGALGFIYQANAPAPDAITQEFLASMSSYDSGQMYQTSSTSASTSQSSASSSSAPSMRAPARSSSPLPPAQSTQEDPHYLEPLPSRATSHVTPIITSFQDDDEDEWEYFEEDED